MLDASDPAAAICLAARKGDLTFLASQPPKKLLLLDRNGDSVITHAAETLLEVPFESAVLCEYAAECALQGWKRSTNAGSYKR